MTVHDRVDLMVALGESIKNDLKNNRVEKYIYAAGVQNPWFTEENVTKSLSNIAHCFLEKSKLESWISQYEIDGTKPKKVGLIMAGNLPLVGFHDALCVFMAGHQALIKLSSKDTILWEYILNILIDLEPRISESLIYSGRLKGYDLVIATGSANSSRYFEHYFGTVPHLIRGNRNSVAVLTGKESASDLEKLGSDIFSFYGLGCRNVNNLMLTKDVDLINLITHFEKWESIKNHHKYFNNYEYYKSIYLINGDEHLDSGFALFKNNSVFTSPVSVVNLHYFDSLGEIDESIGQSLDKVQCAVGNVDLDSIRTLNFGESQMPQLYDYPDNVDVLAFLLDS